MKPRRPPSRQRPSQGRRRPEALSEAGAKAPGERRNAAPKGVSIRSCSKGRDRGGTRGRLRASEVGNGASVGTSLPPGRWCAMELHRYPPRQWITGKKWRRARCGNLHGTPAEGGALRNGAAQAATARGASSERYRGGVRQRRVRRHDNHGAFRRSEEDPCDEHGPAGPTGLRGGYDGRHSGAIGLHLPRGSMATPLLAGTGRDVRLARTPNEAGARSGGRARRKAPPSDMECQRSAGSAVDQDAGTLRRAGNPVAVMENILGGAEQVARS